MRHSKKTHSRRRMRTRARKLRTRRHRRIRHRGGNNNNANYNNNANAPVSELNLIYVKDLYDTIDRIENAAEKRRMVQAVGAWLRAVFLGAPLQNPGNTEASLIASVVHEARTRLQIVLNQQGSEFDAIMHELFKVYTYMQGLPVGSDAYLNLQETQEEFQREYEY
jgi:hypothetical protein